MMEREHIVFVLVILAALLLPALAAAQPVEPLNPVLTAPVRPQASRPSINQQRGMSVVPPMPPPNSPTKPSPRREADVKAWEPFVAAAGDDNPAIESGAIAPVRMVLTDVKGKKQQPSPSMGRLPGGPLVTGSTEGHGADAKPAPASAQQPVANSEGAAITGDGQVYCSNIVDTAADARFAWQKQTIADLARDLDGRMKLLEEKTSEYKIWLQRRDEFIKRATDQLVKIYAKMKADAAAAQLVALDEETAAAVLAKLEPKTSSTILNEMDPVRAARLTGIIAGAARLNDGGKS